MNEIWASVVEAARAMTWVEIAATLFGVTQVVLSAKVSVWTYPVGIISVILAAFHLWAIDLYADASLQAFYFVMSIYGWYKWLSMRAANRSAEILDAGETGRLQVSKCTPGEHLVFVGITGGTWGIIYFILYHHTPSTVPLADSFTTALFFVGMILMALKKIENWIYLIVGDVLCIPLLWYKESYLFSMQFLLFTLIATWGYFEWRKQLKATTS